MQNLLKYQDIDNNIRKIEAEVASSEDKKNANILQNQLKDYQSKLQSLDEKAGIVLSNYKKAETLFEDISKKMVSLDKSSDKIADGKITDSINSVTTSIDTLSRIEKELSNIVQQYNLISKEIENIMKNAKLARKNWQVCKDAFMKYKAEKEPQIDALKKDLAVYEKKVDKNLLAKYKAIRDSKAGSAVVSLKGNRCSGCQMEIPVAGINLLKSKGYIECENCGRIIYFA